MDQQATRIAINVEPIAMAIKAKGFSAAQVGLYAGVSKRVVQLWLQKGGCIQVNHEVVKKVCGKLKIVVPYTSQTNEKETSAIPGRRLSAPAIALRDYVRFFVSVLRTAEAEAGRLSEVMQTAIHQELDTQTGYDHASIRDYRKKDVQEDRLEAVKRSLTVAACTGDLVTASQVGEIIKMAIAASEQRLWHGPERISAWVSTFREPYGSGNTRESYALRVRLEADLLCSVFFDTFMSGIEDTAYRNRIPQVSDGTTRLVGVRNLLRGKAPLLQECARRLAFEGGIDDLRDCQLWRSISERIQAAGLTEHQSEDLIETAARSANDIIRQCVKADCPPEFFTSLAFNTFRDSLLDQLTYQMPIEVMCEPASSFSKYEFSSQEPRKQVTNRVTPLSPAHTTTPNPPPAAAPPSPTPAATPSTQS